MLPQGFQKILDTVNIDSEDNGTVFTNPARREAIKDLLRGSPYCVIAEPSLAVLYAREGYQEQSHFQLISCHIDSLYEAHFVDDYNAGEILGTLDNSICNAVLLDLMLNDRLPANVLLAFTGNEEDGCRGARQICRSLEEHRSEIWNGLEMVIVLDVTGEEYGSRSFTVENQFRRESQEEERRLIFKQEGHLKEFLSDALGDNKYAWVEDALQDESWEFDEFDLNVISFCLPCTAHPDNAEEEIAEWMHSDRGFLVKKTSVPEYEDALAKMVHRIAEVITDL